MMLPVHGRGALLGLAVGDALGTTLEFRELTAPPYPTLATGPHREIIGEGPFRVAPGQVTDDTQMATALASSLRACGRVDPDDLGARYVAWGVPAFDVGGQTRGALDLIERGVPASQAGRQLWLDRDRKPAGNGSLMRTTPIAVFFADQPEQLIAAAMAESAITHFDPRCQLACAGFDTAIAAAVVGRAEASTMVAEASTAIDRAAALLTAQHPDDGTTIADARAALQADLVAAGADDPGVYSDDLHVHRHSGFVRLAFRLAFWHLRHTPSYEDALIDVVNRGGDADTNGAITGALLGAAHGEDAIPARWRAIVLDALAGDPSPFATLYHPRTLLQLIGP